MTDDAFHLTALDARRYDFGNALRGYDRARVDQFRDQVAEELERLSRANQELDAKARNFHEQLRAFRERDKALNDALISAQQLRGEIREQAQREAQLIIREAQGEAERSLESLRGEIRRAEDELQQLWRNRRSYLAQLRNLMERQISDLDNADSTPPPTGVQSRASDSVQPRTAEPSQARASDTVQPRIVEPSQARGAEAPPGSRRDALREVDVEPLRDIPRELVKEFTNDMTREPVREPARDPSREAPREPARVPAPTPAMNTPKYESSDTPRERPRDTGAQRASLPTPSWLDVVEGE